MRPTEEVISRIVDIDTQSENIRKKARDDADNIHKEMLQRIEKEKKDLENLIIEKNKSIMSEADKKCAVEIQNVKNEFSVTSEKIKTIDKDKINKAVSLVLSKVKGF
jgi:hypothetical protein